MKKLKMAFLSAALLASSVANAQWQYNWLVGASVGGGQVSGDVDYFLFNTATGNVLAFSDNHKNSGWLAGILGGYQATCNHWLVGGELSIDWTRRHHTNNFNFNALDVTSTTTRDPMVALTARVGYEVAPCFLPYLRAGIETTRGTLEWSAVDATGATLFDVSGSHRSYGFIGGIGAEMPLAILVDGLSVRAEYNYHSRSGTISADGGFASTVVHADTKPHANTGKVSLVYNFL